MNRRQRITIFVGTVVIAIMIVFPPMKGWYKGYGFLFGSRTVYVPALASSYSNGWEPFSIDQERLIYQVLIAVALTVGTVVLLGRNLRP